MKKYLEFINENKNNDILIIVDVQKEFEKFIQNNLVDELFKYCKNFNSVYQIWDSNKANKPSYKFPNEKGVFEKKYGTSFSKDLKKIGYQLLKSKNPENGDKFEFKDIDASIVRVENNHGWFFVNSKLSDLFESLKDKNVILVGGADGECLTDVFESLKSYGVNVNYNHDFIYSAKTNKNQTINPNL